MSAGYERISRLYSLGKHREAAEAALAILEEEPEDATAHFLLSEIRNAQGDRVEAEKHAREAIALSPGWSAAHWALGKTLLLAGKPEAGDQALAEAQRLDPEDPDVHLLRASADYDAARYVLALERIDAGLALAPDSLQLLCLRAETLRQLDRRAAAREACAAVLAQDPENARMHALKGSMALSDGDRSLALESYKEALRLNPGSPEYKSGLLLAMKAGAPVLGLFIRFGLWLGNMGRGQRIALVVGALFLFNVLKSLMRLWPGLTPFLLPLIAAYLLLLLGNWLADPLLNLLLAAKPYGRYALSGAEKRGAAAFAVCLGFLAASVAVCAVFSLDPARWALFPLVFGFGLFGAAGLGRGSRLRLAHFAAFMVCGLVGASFVAASAGHHAIGFFASALALFVLYVWTVGRFR